MNFFYWKGYIRYKLKAIEFLLYVRFKEEVVSLIFILLQINSIFLRSEFYRLVFHLGIKSLDCWLRPDFRDIRSIFPSLFHSLSRFCSLSLSSSLNVYKFHWINSSKNSIKIKKKNFGECKQVDITSFLCDIYVQILTHGSQLFAIVFHVFFFFLYNIRSNDCVRSIFWKKREK